MLMKNEGASLAATAPALLAAPLLHVESFAFTPQTSLVVRLSLRIYHLFTRRLTSLVLQCEGHGCIRDALMFAERVCVCQRAPQNRRQDGGHGII